MPRCQDASGIATTDPRGYLFTDGVYLDAVAFERTTMERIRKNMERTKDNVRVDIHRSGGWYCHGTSGGRCF